MADTAARIPLAPAPLIAEEVLNLRAPACERIIEIADSIRIGRAHLGDIELVAIPRL